ncbi:putative methyltransferase-domain-containing protein [Amanita rubescens]|nr:putative methyltransferase-domain-containing protein [Amanita rubescens]
MTPIDIALFKILRGYSSLAPPKSLCVPSHYSFTDIHDFFLSILLLSPHLHQYPPSRQYQKPFWKWAIQIMEDLLTEDEEIDSRFYDHYLTTTQEPHDQFLSFANVPPSESYITYYGTPSKNSDDGVDIESVLRLTLFESRTTIEGGTTGLRTWKASFILADHLLSNPELVQAKSVLELGSGVGFLGIVVAAIQHRDMLPGSSLFLTDVDEQVLSRCRRNVSLACNLSSLHSCVQYRIVDWAMSLEKPLSITCQTFLAESNADIVIGADVVFDPSLVPSLVGMLKLCLITEAVKNPKMALIALTVRNVDTLALFISSVKDVDLAIDEMELHYQHVPFVETVVVDGDDPVKVFRITPK